MDDDDFDGTYVISDKRLRDGIKQATDGRLKNAMIRKEGLRTARQILARLMQETSAEEALQIMLGYLHKRIGSDGDKWFNGWNLVAQRFAAELYSGGIEGPLPDEADW